MSKRRQVGSTSTAPIVDDSVHINNLLSTVPVLRSTYLAAARTLGDMCYAERDDDSAFNTHDFAVAFNRVLDCGQSLKNANVQLQQAYALAAKRKQEGFQQLLLPTQMEQ